MSIFFKGGSPSEELYDELGYRPRWGVIVGTVVGVILLLAVIGFGIRWIVAEPEGRLEAREQTVGNGTFRLAAYDHFFSLCTSAQADGDRIANLTAQQEATTDPVWRERLAVTITTVRNQQAATIREYNNDARRDYTVGQFRDSDLPFEIQANEQGEVSCEV